MIIIRKFLLVCLLVLANSKGFSSSVAVDKRFREIALHAKSSEMLNFMNPSQDPCEDFYEFTCGNYYRINPPTMLAVKSSFFDTIANSANRKIATLLQQHHNDDNEITRKAKDFYESCINVPTLQEKYKMKLQEIINEFGHMPVLEANKWQENDFDWLTVVGKIAHKYNIHIIMAFFIGVDNADNTKNRMRILLQEMPLHSPSIYTDEEHAELRSGYREVMAQNLKHFLGLKTKVAEKTARELFQFERDLFVGYNRTQPAIESATVEQVDSGVARNLTTIEEMQKRYFPQLDIKHFVNTSLGFVPAEPVYDLIEQEVENLSVIMQKTPKSIVANYIFYHLVQNFMFTLPKDINLLPDLCIKVSKLYFHKLLDNMIYRSYATKQTQQDIDQMWQLIKSTFEKNLQTNKFPWMRDTTRNYALEKLKTIRMEINSYENVNFHEEFAPLMINNQDLIENLKSFLTLKAQKTRVSLNEPPLAYDDPEVLTFSPVYILTENLIKVPVSLLQPFYLWSDSYPNALKFASLGFLLSHELMHGFDGEGCTYDKAGNNHKWWDQASSEYFLNQTQCLSSQYHEYNYDGEFLPEEKSQTENTADNGGIRLAYNSYLRWYEAARLKHGNMDMELMPRLNYTSQQLFFISYGQLWCSATQPVWRSFAVTTDEHVPDKFRVIGPLSNLEEFSQEFNCPLGSGMNPKKKCVIY